MRPKPPRKRFTPAPLALAAAMTLALAAGHAPQAQAQAQTQGGTASAAAPIAISIPAQPLGQALNELARQANLQMTFPAALVAGKTAPAIVGRFTVREALQQLLAQQDLTFSIDAATVVITATPAASSAATLPPVTVAAGAFVDSSSTRSVGLLPVRPSAGLSRLPVTVREQAQTIQIVPRESLADRGVLSIHEAVETIAGVRPVSPAYSSRSAGIRSRGFESYDTYINGIRISGFGVPVESANVDSVEVVKGPASVQFGLGEPGGALNIVTKRPVAKPLATAKVTLGSFDTKRVEMDLGGAVDDERRVLSRLNVSAEDSDAHRDFDRNRRFSIAPAITWLVSDHTTVDLEVGYLRNDYRFNRGLPPRSFILGLPFDFSTGEPNQPLSDNESLNLFYALQHNLGDGRWSLRQRLGAHRTRSNSFEINSGVGDIDGAGNLSRNFIASNQRENSWVLQHEVHGAFEMAGLQHRALFGFEVGHSGREYGFRGVADPSRDLPALNVFRPVYGGYAFPSGTELKDSYPPETYGNRFQALYADWHTTFSPQWRAMFGLRLDRTQGYYRTTDKSVNYGAADSRGVSPRLGVVWTPAPRTDVFGNLSTGFSPNLFADSAGNLFDTPEKSRQFEIGVRHELVPDRLRATASVFTITKRNVQTPDPSDPTGNRSVLAGEQRSEGFEFELAGAVNRRWDVSLGYAYTDARTTRDSNASQVGVPLVDAPRHHLALWTKYRLDNSLQGWWVGYGLARVSDRRSSSANADFRLPAYTRHDLALGYAAGPWAYQANLGNLTEERVYYTHGNNIHLQPGRNVRVSATYNF
ncbi:TonB-dependent siderophore receptor [Azohydromonas aeria]|uniref:TonB-dependent siderophore receptor n=1 Tax=Azohydromonas aeria TaxID=2590212 RepID=UPI0012FC2B68|nr:TonB-dependent receptor [Azohydromonas aeria]